MRNTILLAMQGAHLDLRDLTRSREAIYIVSAASIVASSAGRCTASLTREQQLATSPSESGAQRRGKDAGEANPFLAGGSSSSILRIHLQLQAAIAAANSNTTTAAAAAC